MKVLRVRTVLGEAGLTLLLESADKFFRKLVGIVVWEYL